MFDFLKADKENRLTAVIVDILKQEVGLVVPVEFNGRSKKRNIATILHQELEKKEVQRSFEFISVKYNVKMYTSILQ